MSGIEKESLTAKVIIDTCYMNKVHSYVKLFMKVLALCLQEAWIPRERIGAPYEPFTSGDGFDLYVDGCRNLPDAVTLSKVDKMVFVCSKSK